MMKRLINLHKILIFLVSMFTSLDMNAQVDPGVNFDLKGFIDQKINAGEKHIVIPPGRYRVPAFNNTHLYFNGNNDITIVADGVEMICTETVQAIKITNCKNFKLQGISVDYDPLPFTQGKIVAMSADKNTLTIDLTDGYSTTLIGDKAEIYDPGTEDLTTSSYYGITYTVNTQTRRVILTKPSNYKLANSYEKIGDIVVIDSRSNKSIPHAIVPDGCTGLVLENVTLYAGTCFGFFEYNCSGSRYINCKIDRRPPTTEIKQRGFKRMRSNNADGFHSKHAEVGPSYVKCLARYMGDDGIAINGDYHLVTATNGTILSVVPKGAGSLNLVVGDSVEMVFYTGKRVPNAKITKIEVGPTLTAAEKQFLQNQEFYGGVANTYKATNLYYVTLNSPVYLPMGSLIASANRIGNGFEVKDCTMGPNRSRGILVKASNGIISGNRLTDNWGEAIKLAPEYGWLEAGSGSNVTVSDNVISGCHDAAIAVYAYGGNGETAPVGAHNNIQITGNSISGSSNPAIAVTSTSKLMLKRNTIESPNNKLLVPWVMNEFGRKEDPSRQIYLKNVENVEVNVGVEDEISFCPIGIKILNNPFSERLRIECSHQKNASFSIYDVMGRKLFSSGIWRDVDIDTSKWNKGLYFLTVEGRGSVNLIKR
jgi:hypothetical protein